MHVYHDRIPIGLIIVCVGALYCTTFPIVVIGHLKCPIYSSMRLSIQVVGRCSAAICGILCVVEDYVIVKYHHALCMDQARAGCFEPYIQAITSDTVTRLGVIIVV